jgi:hypothetical protein
MNTPVNDAERLSAFLADYAPPSRAGKPFEWATRNCAHFATTWIDEATGHDLLEGLPATPDARAALRLLESLGGDLPSAFRRLHKGREISPAQAQTGDILIVPTDAAAGVGHALGICNGRHVMLLDASGAAVFLPATSATRLASEGRRMIRLLIALGLALLCGPALADPVTIVSLAAYALEAAGVITATTAFYVLAPRRSMAPSSSVARRVRSRRSSARNTTPALQDRSVTALQAEPPWRIVYGRAITGGDIVGILTSDKTGIRADGSSYTKFDAYKHLIVAIAAHQCQAINEIYVDGVACGALDGNGWVTAGELCPTVAVLREITIAAGGNSVQPAAVTVLGTPYDTVATVLGVDFTGYVPATFTITGGGAQINNTGANPMSITFTMNVSTPSVRIQKHLGTSSQTADALLTGLLPTEWLATDRLRGLTYCVVTLDLENQRFQGGPPQIEFDVSGRLVLDPRTSTTAWSANPALCMRDFLTNEWGMNCLTTDVDDTYTNAAANACDAAVPIIDFSTAALVTHFNSTGDAESWAASGNGIISGPANGVLTLTSNGADPQLARFGVSIPGAANTAVRVRFKRNAGSGWDGTIFYGNGGHGFSGSFLKTIAQPTYGADGFAEAVWDMSALTAGGSDWTSGTTTQLRIDLGATATDSFDIDWIVVGPMNGPAYTCNGVFTTDQGKEAVLQDLAECMAGFATYGAKWLIQAGAYTSPVMDLGDDDLMGQIELVQGGPGIDEVFNTVRGSYVPQGGWTPTDLDVYAQASYVTADQGVTLATDLTLPFTDNKARGKNLAAIFVERNRLGQVIRFPAKLRAWPLQIGDRVRVTSPEYGFSLNVFRVTDWNFTIAGAVLLTLQADATSVYALPTAATADTARTSGLSSPWVVQTPAGLAATTTSMGDGSFTCRARVTWSAITDPYLADGSGVVLVRWRRQLIDAANVWQALGPIPAADTFAFIENLRAGDAITIEVKFKNGVGAVSSPAYLSFIAGDNSAGRPAAGATADVRLVNEAGMTITGNRATKTGGVNATWDSAWYSVEGYTGGASVFASPAQANLYQMFGLTQHPGAAVSYTNIDFAIYPDNAGNLLVYELGTLIGTIGTYAALDALSVQYDGQWVYYVKNGTILSQRPAPAGLSLYAQGSHYSSASTLQNIKFGPMSSTHKARGANLMDASWWRVGVNPVATWLGNQSGAGAADAFVNAVTPDGVVAPVWQATQGAGAANGGGWNNSIAPDATNRFPIDPSKTYLFACFIRQPSVASGSVYWGIEGNVVDAVNTGTQQGNPYFVPGASPPVGKWVLCLGYVFPNGSTGNASGREGMWDCTTGLKLAAGTNYNWHAGVQSASTRAYQFFATVGNLCQFSAPQVFLVDGSEPAFEDLMSMVVPTLRLAANAATDVITAAASSITVTGNYRHNSSGSFSTNDTWTQLCSATFTPSVDCDVLVSVTAQIQRARVGRLGDLGSPGGRLQRGLHRERRRRHALGRGRRRRHEREDLSRADHVHEAHRAHRGRVGHDRRAGAKDLRRRHVQLHAGRHDDRACQAMNTWHFYDAASGLFVGRSYGGPPEFLALNTPQGCAALPEAQLQGGDPQRYRVDVLARQLVPYTPPAAVPDDATLAARARSRRDDLLTASDRTQLPDTPLTILQVAQWKLFRAALRNLPQQPGFPRTLTWPSDPDGNSTAPPTDTPRVLPPQPPVDLPPAVQPPAPTPPPPLPPAPTPT